MHRRTVLAALSALLAGCAGSDERSTTRSPDSSTPTPTKTPSDTPTETATPTETPTPEPPWLGYERLELDRPSLSEATIRGRLDAHDCSELKGGDVVCPGDDARLSVSISSRTISLPGGEIQLSVRNDADEPLSWNVASWEVAKYDGDSWRKLAPIRWTQAEYTLEPGKAHDYPIRVDDTTFEDIPLSVDDEMFSFHGLGPGVYGFVNDSGHYGSDHENTIPFGALFGVYGRAPALEPTDAIERIERNGSELHVRSDPGQYTERELVVTRTDEAEVQLLPEHVRLCEGLRNTVTFLAADGIDTVRYRTAAPRYHTARNYVQTVAYDAGQPAHEPSSYGFADVAFEVDQS